MGVIAGLHQETRWPSAPGWRISFTKCYVCLGTSESFLVHLPECDRSVARAPSILASSLLALFLAARAVTACLALEKGQLYLDNLRRAGLEGRTTKGPSCGLTEAQRILRFPLHSRKVKRRFLCAPVSLSTHFFIIFFFLVLAFQTTDGRHLESIGFLYRSNSMWNGFSEPEHFRETKDDRIASPVQCGRM